MFERDLVLPESEREAFKSPLGSELPESLVDTTGETTYIAVGDVVSLVLRRCGARPVLSVYDGLTERREMTDFARLVEDEPRIDVVNPAGRISAGLAEALRRGIGGETALVRVDGEEDLAVLPCLVMAPEGSRIVYGMPGRCMMEIAVNGESRGRAEELLSRMEEME